ncbi:MAB_1171c family putative transporter [Streptomyces sp. NPDC020681]|uniref:MAB_1171c family putative transporter n=1 Tax=Streptomyces sp. NPDC020681 TaxID=3365083 RepID=UPI0037B487CC
MSENASTIVYLIIAVSNFAIAGWKGLALLRDPTPTLTLITSTFVCSGVVYVMAAPAGYRALGEAVGQSSFATLPVYVGILFCFAHLHLLTLLWNPQLRKTPTTLRSRLIAWSMAYGTAAVLMVISFSAADLSGPSAPLTFNTTFAHDQVVLLFLAIFLSTLTCGTLSTFRQCRKITLEDPRLQHALRSFGIAMLFVFGYVVCGVPAIALAATGHHALDALGVFGSTFGATGALIASYGLSGAAVSAWLRERRDIKALQPLWDLVVEGVDEDLAFSASSARSHRLAWNVTFNLHRRVIEILDGMRALRPWLSLAPMQAVYSLHERQASQHSGETPRLPEHEVQAAATAAALRDAVESMQAARREQAHHSRARRPQAPEGPAVPLPGQDTPAAVERDRLLRVAQWLTSPLVTAALQEVRGTGNDHAVSKTA